MIIYLAGYAGREPREFADRTEALGAVVVDIRNDCYEKASAWDYAALQRLQSTLF